MPDRSLTYFFSFETTINMSRSKLFDSTTTDGGEAPDVTTRAGPDGENEGAGVLLTITRAGGGDETDDDEGVLGAGGDVSAGARGAGAKVAGRSGAVGASERWVGEAPLSPRWDSHAARVGARSSTAHDSRWRTVERCESQQATEQNTRRVRSRLQVETLHTQYTA